MKKKSVVKPSGSATVRDNKLASSSLPTDVVDQAALLADLRMLILSARQRIASVANSTYTLLCWQVGSRLLRENLQAGRAAYGKQILATVSQELTVQFGTGFSYTAQLDAKSIRVSEYLTELPPLPLLRARLHQAIIHAREQAARRLPDDGCQP